MGRARRDQREQGAASPPACPRRHTASAGKRSSAERLAPFTVYVSGTVSPKPGRGPWSGLVSGKLHARPATSARSSRTGKRRARSGTRAPNLCIPRWRRAVAAQRAQGSRALRR